MSDIGQPVFKANPVRKPPNGPRRTDKIPKLPCAIKGRGVVINMIVDVMPVNVRGNEKGVFAFRPAHCRFIAYPIGFLRRDFAAKKRLPDLIAEDVRILFLLSARDGFVPPLPISCEVDGIDRKYSINRSPSFNCGGRATRL
jgi:hypothetical protein